MDRDDALKLLRGGEDGVREWNRRREGGEQIPDLSGANLSLANLCGANLCGANLSGAKLSHVQCRKTVFADIDLSSANGLEEIIREGPSIVGVDTLYKSKGQIPLAFLRACGVPENLIQYLSSLTNQAIDFYSCFISYSHADKAIA